MERKLHRTFISGSEKAWERKGQGAKRPRNESSRERIGRLARGYDSRLRGLRFSPFFQHGSTPKPYNNIMLPCDSGADKSNSCNSSANFPPIQIMQLCLTLIWHCSVNYSVNNKSRDQFWFLIGEVSILVFRFWRNIDTTTGNTAPLKNYHSHDHCLLNKWKHVTCAETLLDASTQNGKSRVEKDFACHMDVIIIMFVYYSCSQNATTEGTTILYKWVPYSQWYLFRQTCKRRSQPDTNHCTNPTNPNGNSKQ